MCVFFWVDFSIWFPVSLLLMRTSPSSHLLKCSQCSEPLLRARYLQCNGPVLSLTFQYKCLNGLITTVLLLQTKVLTRAYVVWSPPRRYMPSSVCHRKWRSTCPLQSIVTAQKKIKKNTVLDQIITHNFVLVILHVWSQIKRTKSDRCAFFLNFTQNTKLRLTNKWEIIPSAFLVMRM